MLSYHPQYYRWPKVQHMVDKCLHHPHTDLLRAQRRSEIAGLASLVQRHIRLYTQKTQVSNGFASLPRFFGLTEGLGPNAD